MHYQTVLSNKAKEAYSRNPTKCNHCKKVLTYHQRYNKFCSKICSGKFYTKLPDIIKEITINGQVFYTRECPTCNKTIVQTRRANANRMFEENRECRKCSKSITLNSVMKKRIKSFKKTIKMIRKAKGYR